MVSRTLLRSGALLLVFAIVPACTNEVLVAPPFSHTLNSALDGSQVVPGVASAATGSATFELDEAQTKIKFTLNVTGVGIVTSVKVHAGEPGANGPALFTLAAGPFTNPLTGTLTDVDLMPGPGASSFHAATLSMLAGRTYVVVRCVANPDGEIRGHIGTSSLASVRMTGAQMVGPVVTTAGGSATATLNDAQSQIVVTLTFTGIASATSAHLHAGKAGVAGPAVFDLSTVAFSSPLTKTLTAADFTPGGGLLTFSDAVAALLGGRLNIDVHSAAFLTGEIRGQIGAAQVAAALTGGAVNPVNTSTATGTATVALSALQDSATVLLSHTVPAANATGVLIHAETVGNNGPLIFNIGLAAGTALSPIDVVVDAFDLVPQILQLVTTFPEAVDAFLTGRTYIDVQTTGFPLGEIRGQLVP